jgi:hypothetical protein
MVLYKEPAVGTWCHWPTLPRKYLASAPSEGSDLMGSGDMSLCVCTKSNCAARYHETFSYIWREKQWVDGPREATFIKIGGLLSKPEFLDAITGFAKWSNGFSDPWSY